MGKKSVAEQRKATQANTLRKRKEEAFFFLFCSKIGGMFGVAQVSGGERLQPGAGNHSRGATLFHLLL